MKKDKAETTMNNKNQSFDINMLTAMLEKRSGHCINSPADCEWLSVDFETRAGEKISVNTLKR